MQKTTLYLDEVDYRTLKRIAAGRDRTPAELVREAVAEYVSRHAPTSRPRSIGAFASGRTDLSERAEDLLSGFGRPRRGRKHGRR
jgi:hypothetical protein